MQTRSRTSRIARNRSSQVIQRKTPAAVLSEESELPPPSIAAQLQTAQRGHSLSKISVGDRLPLQTKLTVNQPGDVYEQEADHMAEAVMRMSGEAVQRTCDCGGEAAPDGECAACKAKRLNLQTESSAADVDVRRQPAALSRIAGSDPLVSRAPQNNRPACGGTNRRSSPEHELIQADYIATKDPTGVREYMIPGGSANGNVGYADLVSLGSHAIYEIKPYSPPAITEGLAQVAQYIVAARTSCDPDAPWHPGIAYPDTVLSMGAMELVAKQYNNPGLILYYTRKKQQEINWETVLEVVVTLGLSISLVAVIIAALLDPEPATKLALAGLSAVMISTILQRFGLSEEPTS